MSAVQVPFSPGVCKRRLRALRLHGCCSLASNSFPHSFPKILSGLNAFEISNLQEQETESHYPGDPDVTMLHGAEKLLLNGVFADHNSSMVVIFLKFGVRQKLFGRFC